MAKHTITFERELSFGVEIEIANIDGTKEEVAKALRSAGLKAKAISSVEHANYNEWKVEFDGSLRGCQNPMEIVSPILKGVEGLRELELMLEVINGLNAKVNKQCGIHVHHGAKDLTLNQIKNVYRLYAKHEQSIDEIFPQSRFNNYYAKLINGYFEQAYKYGLPSNTTVLQAVEQMDSIEKYKEVLGASNNSRTYYREERYYKINAVAYVAHGTLEFRQHSGSTEYDKISNWVILTHKLLEIAQLKGDKKVRPKGAKRVEICENGGQGREGYVHRNYDLYTELGLGGTTVSEFIGKRAKEFRAKGLGKRGEYIKAN